jgi:hypothetical protein
MELEIIMRDKSRLKSQILGSYVETRPKMMVICDMSVKGGRLEGEVSRRGRVKE